MQENYSANTTQITRILENLYKSLDIPKYKTLLEFLEDGFYLTPNDRYSKFDIEMSPWCKTLSEWFEDINTNWCYLVMGSQVSKTTFMIGVLLYVSQYVRGAVPCMWVHNTQTEVKKFVKDRLMVLLNNPDNATKKGADRWATEGFYFNNSYLKIGYATTKDSMASIPARFVFGDECGKWKESTSYAKLRTRTFEGTNFFGIFASTPPPTTDHHFVKEYKAGNFYRWFVPCPKCNVFQYKTFTQLKWEGKNDEGIWDYNKVQESAHYECKHCGEHWKDSDKIEIINKGKMVCVNEETGEPCEEYPSDTKTLQINGLYSVHTSYGKLAKNFLTAKASGPEALKNFLTDELAEVPEDEIGYSMKHEQLSKYIDYGRKCGDLNDEYQLITAGADVQRAGKIYYTVLGWKTKRARVSGHVIDYGVVRWRDEKDAFYWDEFLEALEPYIKYLSKIGIDATDGVVESEIYDFCYTNGTQFLPIKDAGNLKEKYSHKRIGDLPGSKKKAAYRKFFQQEVLSIRSSAYKDLLSSAFCRDPESEDSWSFPRDTKDDYFYHLLNEHRKRIKVGGSWQEKWMPKYSGAPQHWFSSLVYGTAVMDIFKHRLQSKLRLQNASKNNQLPQRGRRVRNRGGRL